MQKVIESTLVRRAKIAIDNLTTVDFQITESLMENTKSCVLHGSVGHSGYGSISVKAISPGELKAYIEGLKVMLSNYQLRYSDYYFNPEE